MMIPYISEILKQKEKYQTVKQLITKARVSELQYFNLL